MDGEGLTVELQNLSTGASRPWSMPTVAAIICNYNQGAYLEAAVSSLFNQTYPHLECVIVDDCSTDGSRELITRLAEPSTPRSVRVILHDENRGQMAAMMSGFDATSAPFVAWLDADDIWLPRYVERHIAYHLSNQIAAAITTSDLALIDAAGTVIAGGPMPLPRFPATKTTCSVAPARLHDDSGEIDYPEGPRREAEFLSPRHAGGWLWSATSGMVFRRATIELVRPIEAEKLRICADNYLARFSHLVGGTIRIGETLGYYRLHGSNNYSKGKIFGYGQAPGDTSRPIQVEGNRQIARKLLDACDPLTRSLPPRDRHGLLMEVAGAPGTFHSRLLRGTRWSRRVRYLAKCIKVRAKHWRRALRH